MADIKIDVLAEFLDVDSSEIKISHEYDNIYECGTQEYLIYNENERDGKICEYIKELIMDTGWCFNLKLKNYVISDYEGIGANLWYVANHMEDFCDEEIYSVVSKGAEYNYIDTGKILTDVERTNDVGILMASYDGKENIFEYKNKDYYIYRCN